jgi:L-iditol 2-dehydrogenase
VKVEAVGLCGSDFHIFSGEANYNLDQRGRPVPLEREPQILGHEITGVVEEAGGEVQDLHSGDRVVLDQGLNCQSQERRPLCEYCATGDSHQCEHYREHGITGLPGGLAEAIALPAINAVKIGSGLDPALAAVTEPLACVLHASDVVARTKTRYAHPGAAGEGQARSILICGLGPAGQIFVQVLRRVFGYDGVLLAADPAAHKRSLAARAGATVIDPASVDLVEAVLEHTRGRRVEYLIEAAGSGPLFEMLPGLIRKQATVLLYGYGHRGASLEALNPFQWREPVLVATTGASGGFDPDGRPSVYRRALRLIEEGTIEVRSLVTHRYRSLGEVPAALASAGSEPGYVKGVVRF